MPTKKHRYMIILDEVTKVALERVMSALNTKQQSKAIAYCVQYTLINDIDKIKE